MVKKLLLSLFLFTSLTFGESKESQFDSLVTKGVKEIYNIQFEEAENSFRVLMANYPEHPAGRFFLAMIDWWRILLDPDVEIYDDLFFQKLEDVIYHCDNILEKDENNIDALFFKGGAIGFRGRLRSLRESWLKAADDGREALPIIQRAARLDPTNIDVQLGFGLYNYFIEVIPERYPLMKPLMIFFPDGDRQKGIEQLTLTATEGRYAKFEAQNFLMQLYDQFENNPYKAEEYAKMLNEKFPNNPNFERYRGRIAIRRGDSYFAFNIFQNIYSKVENEVFGYTDKVEREATYYIGLHYRNIGNFDSAKVYFELSENLSLKLDKKRESGFLINTVLYLGMIYDVFGERSKARKYYERVLDMREFGQSHVMAKQYLETPFRQ